MLTASKFIKTVSLLNQKLKLKNENCGIGLGRMTGFVVLLC